MRKTNKNSYTALLAYIVMLILAALFLAFPISGYDDNGLNTTFNCNANYLICGSFSEPIVDNNQFNYSGNAHNQTEGKIFSENSGSDHGFMSNNYVFQPTNTNWTLETKWSCNNTQEGYYSGLEIGDLYNLGDETRYISRIASDSNIYVSGTQYDDYIPNMNVTVQFTRNGSTSAYYTMRYSNGTTHFMSTPISGVDTNIYNLRFFSFGGQNCSTYYVVAWNGTPSDVPEFVNTANYYIKLNKGNYYNNNLTQIYHNIYNSSSANFTTSQLREYLQITPKISTDYNGSRFLHTLSYNGDTITLFGNISNSSTLNFTIVDINITFKDIVTGERIYPDSVVAGNLTLTQGLLNYRLTTLRPEIYQRLQINASKGGYINISMTVNLSDYVVNQTFNMTYANVSICSPSYPYSILNISLRDGLTNNLLSVATFYNLSFYDGRITHTLAQNITTENFAFCTNVNPTTQPFNWANYGYYQLAKTNYESKMITYPQDAPLIISNNPPTNISLYLYTINSTSTVTFSWLYVDYTLVNGLMRIYKCEPDGSKTLVDTATISNGQASANLILLSQLYAYDVIIGSTVYSDTSYNTCHTEPDTSATYYIDLTSNTFQETFGLQIISCELSYLGTTATLEWGDNTLNDAPIQGCILSAESSSDVTGTTLSCANSTSGHTLTYTVTDATINYLKGRLIQEDGVRQCNTVTLNAERTDIFGKTGLFLAFILILSLALLQVNPILSIIFSIIGLIASFVLTLLAISWMGLLSGIMFLIAILVIARYNRKE